MQIFFHPLFRAYTKLEEYLKHHILPNKYWWQKLSVLIMVPQASHLKFFNDSKPVFNFPVKNGKWFTAITYADYNTLGYQKAHSMCDTSHTWQIISMDITTQQDTDSVTVAYQERVRKQAHCRDISIKNMLWTTNLDIIQERNITYYRRRSYL